MKLQAPKETVSVIERARQYLAKCPPAVSGQGGHKATFRAACVLVNGFALAEAEALSLLREWNHGCQPPWSESELIHKIRSAMGASSDQPRGHLAQSKGGSKSAGLAVPKHEVPISAALELAVARPGKPKFSPEILSRVAALRPEVDEQFIKDRSPVCPETQTPASFLQRLYRPGEWVIVFDVFRSQGRHVCQWSEPPYDANCLDHLINGCPNGVWFLCNPVDGEFHSNPRLGGKRSRRSEEAITSWRFLLVESDKAAPRPWLAALVQMPLRIAAIYKSAGKSIHALIQLDAASKAEWEAKAKEIKSLLIVLGADSSAMSAVQLTRLPGCYRGQTGPPPPKGLPVRKRWVDEPLEFDGNGDPIWEPAAGSEEPPPNLWTGGRLQELLYLNPTPDLEPIHRKPTRREIHEKWLASFAQ